MYHENIANSLSKSRYFGLKKPDYENAAKTYIIAAKKYSNIIDIERCYNLGAENYLKNGNNNIAAKLYNELGIMVNSVKYFFRAYKLEPTNIIYINNLIDIYIKKSEYKKLIIVFMEILKNQTLENKGKVYCNMFLATILAGDIVGGKILIKDIHIYDISPKFKIDLENILDAYSNRLIIDPFEFYNFDSILINKYNKYIKEINENYEKNDLDDLL